MKTAIFMELSSSTGAIILYKDFNELKTNFQDLVIHLKMKISLEKRI